MSICIIGIMNIRPASICILVLLFPIFLGLAVPVQAQEVQQQEYTDEENDVYDSQLRITTSEKTAYDILNTTIRFLPEYIELQLFVKGSIDLDGFYIFQCLGADSTDYVFSYSRLEYIGRDGSGNEIKIDGQTEADNIRISILRAKIKDSTGLRLMNVSAQDSDLRYVDVMDSSVQYDGGATLNKMIIEVHSPEFIAMTFTTRYEDSRAFKFNMDADRNGYISVDESGEFGYQTEMGLRRYIQDNTESFYSSMLYVNGRMPWDLGVRVDVSIDQIKVDVPDNSSIVIYYSIDYKTSADPDGMFTLSLPINGSFLRDYEAPFELKIDLKEELYVEAGGTDAALRPMLYSNGTGLGADEKQLEPLEEKRYILKIGGGETTESDLRIYMLIALAGVVLAGIIFFAYSQKKFKDAGGKDGDDGGEEEEAPRDRGKGRVEQKKPKKRKKNGESEDRMNKKNKKPKSGKMKKNEKQIKGTKNKGKKKGRKK